MPDEDFSDVAHELIQRIYLAGANADLWPEFLEVLCQRIDAGNATLSFIDRETGGISVTATARLDADVIDLYRQRFAGIDPFGNGAAALGPIRPGFIGLAQDLISDEELFRTEYYHRFGKLHGCIGGIICVVYADGPLAATIGANRKPGRFFGEPEVTLFRTLFPHLRTALQIHRELLAEAQLGRAALSTLNHLSSAAFICDENSTVLHMNVAAGRLGSRLVRGGRLELPSAGETQRLRRAVSDAARAAVTATGGEAWVHLASLFDSPTAALVSPVHQERVVRLIRPMVAVLLSVPTSVTAKAVTVLTEMYSFTPSEARLAQALVNGQPVRAAAQELGISYQTARSYVKRLLEKTGTNRQAELMRTLLTSVVD